MLDYHHTPISYIGNGSPGGKASGLIRIQSFLSGIFHDNEYYGIRVGIPRMTVLLSNVFGKFVKENNLTIESMSRKSDSQIALVFHKSSFPATLTGAIRSLSDNIKLPLAVRSSSLTEDSLDQPFAGIFATKMIPNNNPDPDARFRELIDAIKFVFASTWFESSRDSFQSAGLDLSLERMAVIIQCVHGARHNRYFYPAFSGVGRSYNYYPFNNCKSEDGVVELAAGLGKAIVDGGRKWIYIPTSPEQPPPASLKNILDSGQNKFWSINLAPPEKENPFTETEYMTRLPLKVLEKDGILGSICSTYSSSSDRLEMGLRPSGFRLVNFSPILTGEINRFNGLILNLLEKCRENSGCDVEIEFAVNLSPDNPGKADFAFLQIRPMKVPTEIISSDSFELNSNNVIVYSENALGNFYSDDIEDFVFINPSAFNPLKTAEMPLELEKINRTFIEDGKKYILAGFGRWGSSDPSLGIPVKWSQISSAGLIIESTIPEMNPELSQGSHFFHNILNTGIPYLSIDEHNTKSAGFINYDWLKKQEISYSGKYFFHIKSKKKIKIVIDGRKRRGIITK